ncbi:HD-GYP domain-containing protein [Treponema sp.]|uniref:HD-GYP domain-containing protein n=1 Tax=Treponema sp. TaxID=166 RepID=UPI003F113F64
MKEDDKEFFIENIVNVNRTTEKILFGTIIVPVVFYIFTVIGLWEVPHAFSVSLFFQEIIVSLISHFINRVSNKKFQYFSMYFETIAASIFVAAMAYSGAIRLSISYALIPIISCLYYNKRLSRLTTIYNYIFVILIVIYKSYTIFDVIVGRFTREIWIIQMCMGYTVEFAFLFFTINQLCKRTHRTMTKLNRTKNEYNNLNEILIEKNRSLDKTQYKIIQFVSQCLGSHDLFTGHHVAHTQVYVEMICRQLVASGHYKAELTERNIYLFQNAAFLHDIGKIHIPEGVLNKIGKFTDAEFELMKTHPVEGHKLLEFLPSIGNGEFNKIAKQMCLWHHEKWNGTGYPDGLREYEIPLCARIMAAADVLDALISQRLYKEAMDVDSALVIFENTSGIHFEPAISKAVVDCRNKIIEIDNQFKETEAKQNSEELKWWQDYHENLKKIVS